MFVRAIQHHQMHPAIQSDPKLKAACASFVSQESVHGREHDYLNDRLKEQYPIAHSLERLVELITYGVTTFLPHRTNLGSTVALEHWTAIMAGFLLSCPLGPNGGVFGTEAARDSRFGLVWQWHACEETEHKAVAFDCFERYYGRGPRAYISRCTSLMLATLIFWSLVPVSSTCTPALNASVCRASSFFTLCAHLLLVRCVPLSLHLQLFTLALVISDGQLFNFAGWLELAHVLLISPGMIPRIWPAFCDYFRYSFHPWSA